MDDTNGGKSEYALRLALSYRDKAQTLRRECEEAREAGRIQEAEYRSLQEFYSRHTEHAQERLDFLHREHRRRADALREDIQDTARRQAELSDLATARDIGLHKANRLNRRYRATIEDLRGRYQLEERLASARDANEVGGFIDLPLDKYQAGPTGRAITLPGMDRLVATAVAILGSLAVFLPWFSIAGDVRPLAGVPALLGLEERIGAGGVIGLIVLFLVCPLGGSLFAWIENPRRSGAGMVATGLGMLALTVLALLATGMLTTGQILLTELLGGLRLGALLHVVAAVQLVLLGLRRARLADTQESRGGVLIGFTGLIIAFAVLGIVFHLATSSGQPFLRFRFAPPDPATGTIAILVGNDGTAPANLYVPWPEGRAQSVPAEERSEAFGLELYVQEAPTAPFRLYPASQDCWRTNGRPLTAAAPVPILPDGEAALNLLPYAARQGGINPQAVRIVASDGNGKVAASFEAVLPSAPGPAR